MPHLMNKTETINPSGVVNRRIPTYLPLPDAARKYGLSEKVLTQLIQAGKIDAVQLPTGQLLVAAEKNGQELKTKTEIIGGKVRSFTGTGH